MAVQTLIETSDCAGWHDYIRSVIERDLKPSVVGGFRASCQKALSELMENNLLDVGLPEEPDGRAFMADCAIFAGLLHLQGRPAGEFLDALSEGVFSTVNTPNGPLPWLAGFRLIWELRHLGVDGPVLIRVWTDDEDRLEMGFRLRPGTKIIDAKSHVHMVSGRQPRDRAAGVSANGA